MKRFFALFAVICLCWIGFVGCSSNGTTSPFSQDDDGGNASGDASKSDGGGFKSDASAKDAATSDGSVEEDGSVRDSGVDSGFDAGVDAGPSFNVTSAASTGLTTITVTFDAAPNATEAASAANYAVTGGSGLTVSAPVLAGNTVTLTTTTQSAIAYTMTVTGITRADDGRALTLDHASFTGLGAFDVSSATATSPTTVNVVFDAVPNATAAALATNYVISDGATTLAISAATLTGSTVTLTTATQAASAYTVTVSNVTRASDAQPLSISTANFTGISPFNVTSATATSATQVTVTFDAPPTSALATLATNYAITSGATTLAVSAATLSGSTVTLTTAPQSAATYTVTVSNVKRASDSLALATNSATFTGIPPFTVDSAISTSSTTVDVAFGSAPTTASATTAANYAIPGLTISAASLTGAVVTLTTSTQSAQSYTVTVSNVTRSSDSAPLTTTTASFTGSAPAGSPTVTNVAVVSTVPDNGTTAYNTGTTAVTITGSGFTGIACATAVKLDDLDGVGTAVGTKLNAGCTVDSDTQISGVFPAGIRTNGSTGWNVIVTNSVSHNATSTVKFVPVAGLLISEVMIGSGTSSSPADHEFVEIYNPTGTAINTVTLGMKLHIRGGTGNEGGNHPLTLVSGKSLTIASHGYLLIAPAGLTGDTWDATIDATYAGSAMPGNGGVYVSLSTTINSLVIDKLGWGTQPAGGFEGTVTANLTNDNSAQRKPGSVAGTRTDSDVNSADFLAPSTAITPKGTVSAVEP